MSIPTALKKKREALMAQSNISAEPTQETVNSDTPVLESPEVMLPVPEAINEPVVAPVIPPVIEQPSNTVPISTEELQRLKTADGIAKKASEEAKAAKDESMRLSREIEMLNETMDKILLSKEEPKPVETPPEPVKPPISFNTEELTDDEKYVIGELEPAIRKIAKLVFQELFPTVLQAVQQEIEPFKGKVESTVKTVAKQNEANFVQNLQSAITKAGYGNYDVVQVDNSKDFADWIKNKEDLSGNKYTAAYLDAVKKTFDIALASRIQKEFLDWFTAQLPKETVAATPPPIVSQTPVVEHPQIPEDMISPPRSNTSSVPAGQRLGELITPAQLKEYGHQVAIGASGATKEEFENLKKRYFAQIAAQTKK
jgi:hypothetical protein